LNWVARLYLWATHRLYDEFAWAYDLVSWLVSFGQWASRREVALDHVIGQRVLEVGFGTGELLIAMARRNLHVYGLERSLAMQQIATNKMKRRGVWVPRVLGVVQEMPFADGCFDSIIATFPAEYILDPATLYEVARLLRSPNPATARRGGRFIVVGMGLSTNSALLRRALRLIFGTPAESTYAKYEQIATAAGLCVTVISQKGKCLSVPVVVSEKRNS